MKIPVYYLLGKPGAGKGSQNDTLQDLLGIVSMSTGEILRAEAALPTERGRMIADIQRNSGLVPNEVVAKIMLDEVQKPKYAGGILLDGLPRSLEQDDWVQTWGEVKGIFYINVPDEICKKRIMGRATRPEDTDEAGVEKRIREDITMKILAKYADSEVPLYDVDGTGTIPEVTELLKAKYQAAQE
jgi:adenylate kinase